jgi:hypothetical protein
MSIGNGWTPERVSQQFATEGNQQFQLDHPIPVHVTYFTVRVSDTGELTYIDDIYGHDRRTMLAIEGEWSQVEKQLAPKVTQDEALYAEIGRFQSTFAVAGRGTGLQTRTPAQSWSAANPADHYSGSHR